MTTMYIITVNTTKFWCLLQQDVTTHVGHRMLCFYTCLAWQWPTWVGKCCYDKHQNLITLTVIINIVKVSRPNIRLPKSGHGLF